MFLFANLLLLGLAVATTGRAEMIAWGQLIILALGSIRFFADWRESLWNVGVSWLFLAFACLLPADASTSDLGTGDWARLSLWITLAAAGLSGAIRLTSRTHLGWLIGLLITLAPPALWYLATDFSNLRPAQNPFSPSTFSHHQEQSLAQITSASIFIFLCLAGWTREHRSKREATKGFQQAH